MAEIAEKERLSKIEAEMRELREQQERERYMAEIKAAHEKRLAEEALAEQRRIEQRNEEEILSQANWSKKSKDSQKNSNISQIKITENDEDSHPANEQTIDLLNISFQSEKDLRRQPLTVQQSALASARDVKQYSESSGTPKANQIEMIHNRFVDTSAPAPHESP